MKKVTRMLAALAAVATMTVSAVTVNAEADLLSLYYEAGTDEYVDCCKDMTKVPYEEKLGALLNTGIDQKWHSVYYAPCRNDETFKDDKISDIKYGNANEYMIEIDDPNNATEKDYRRFIGIKIYFNNLFDMDGKGGMLSNSIENINSFLKENGYDAKVELNSLNEDWIDRLYITYGEDVNTKEMVDILYSLYQEFDLEPFTYGTYGSIVIAGASLSDWEPGDLIYYDTLGDANNDNELNVRDCSFIANVIANGKGAELPDSADYNKDGNKNIRDAALIARELAEKK